MVFLWLAYVILARFQQQKEMVLIVSIKLYFKNFQFLIFVVCVLNPEQRKFFMAWLCFFSIFLLFLTIEIGPFGPTPNKFCANCNVSCFCQGI